MEGGGEAVFEPSVPAWGVQGVGMELTTASIAFTEEMWVIEAVHYASDCSSSDTTLHVVP